MMHRKTIFYNNHFEIEINFLIDGEFQLTDPRSAKIFDEVVEEIPKYSILVP